VTKQSFSEYKCLRRGGRTSPWQFLKVASPEAAVEEIRKYNAMPGVGCPFFYRGIWPTYTIAGDTLMPGQQLPNLTPAEAAILVPHHHAPAPPVPAVVQGPLMQMLTATIANADLEPPPPPPGLEPIAVDDWNLLMRALCARADVLPNRRRHPQRG
jgi:hypothetical protein